MIEAVAIFKAKALELGLWDGLTPDQPEFWEKHGWEYVEHVDYRFDIYYVVKGLGFECTLLKISNWKHGDDITVELPLFLNAYRGNKFPNLTKAFLFANDFVKDVKKYYEN